MSYHQNMVTYEICKTLIHSLDCNYTAQTKTGLMDLKIDILNELHHRFLTLFILRMC